VIGHPADGDPETRKQLLALIARHLQEAVMASDDGDVAAFRDALEHVVQLVIGLDLAEIGTVRANPRYLELRSRNYTDRRAKLRALEDHRVLLYEALERAKDRGDTEEVREVAEESIPAVEAEITELSRAVVPQTAERPTVS
jgi:hypothetical protein